MRQDNILETHFQNQSQHFSSTSSWSIYHILIAHITTKIPRYVSRLWEHLQPNLFLKLWKIHPFLNLLEFTTLAILLVLLKILNKHGNSFYFLCLIHGLFLQQSSCENSSQFRNFDIGCGPFGREYWELPSHVVNELTWATISLHSPSSFSRTYNIGLKPSKRFSISTCLPSLAHQAISISFGK